MNGAKFLKYASQIAAGLALSCVVGSAAAQDQALHASAQSASAANSAPQQSATSEDEFTRSIECAVGGVRTDCDNIDMRRATEGASAAITQYQAMPDESKMLIRCTAGNPSDCIDYGVALAKGTPKLPQDRARAITYFDGACSKGRVVGCRNSGSTNIALGEASYPAARAAYEKACLLGDGNSCFRQAMMVGRGAGGIKDPKQGVILMKKSCSLKFEEACATIQRADAKRAERAKKAAGKPYDIDAKVPAQ